MHVSVIYIGTTVLILNEYGRAQAMGCLVQVNWLSIEGNRIHME